MKAMKAYFQINSSIYVNNDEKIMAMLNKMSKGRGVPFSEMWYNKMVNPAIQMSNKSFDKFTTNFNSTFFPFDIKATAHLKLTKLVQKSFRCPDRASGDGFQKYITNFQNLSARAGITDDITLINQFSLRLNQ